ncbi:5918_t:CDS:2 [Funneliformis geosporum]|uniref:2393_t:CDS:1 n=1 Tax=Funneliformis geosporum TaxID=1117311 RepID=A0A9W4SG26_9GLOM|nr:2393_t:CDS:2 [Funneliformis geosporum]CAI2168543.1 5918_t:CDS:2 [Funneliformis geosporum]
MKDLYPKVLEELLIRRNLLKRRLALLNDKKEELEKKINLAEERGIVVTDTLKSKYSSVVFNIAYLDVKHLTLKVYINTFYDEAENILASGIILAGQQNIKLIANLVRSKRFSVKYENTDFLYFVCLEECFQKCDKIYDNDNGISKEKYWSRMVNISMEVIERFRDKVNDFFRNNNESSYLKMMYEEVLFSVVFTEKKKYYSISHKKDVLKETINVISQIDLNGVVKTAMWKSDKNNKSI